MDGGLVRSQLGSANFISKLSQDNGSGIEATIWAYPGDGPGRKQLLHSHVQDITDWLDEMVETPWNCCDQGHLK